MWRTHMTVWERASDRHAGRDSRRSPRDTAWQKQGMTLTVLQQLQMKAHTHSDPRACSDGTVCHLPTVCLRCSRTLETDPDCRCTGAWRAQAHCKQISMHPPRSEPTLWRAGHTRFESQTRPSMTAVCVEIIRWLRFWGCRGFTGGRQVASRSMRWNQVNAARH